MASKQVRKITSITANELVKVDMADRDGDGKKIKDTYATNAALTSAVNSANSGIDANSAAIASLGTRMTTAEGDISANASAISTEASTRATAVSNEATARANADTALGGRIDSVSAAVTAEATTRANADVALGGRIDNANAAIAAETIARQTDIDRIEAVANGRTKTFALSVYDSNQVLDTFNGVFDADGTVRVTLKQTGSGADLHVFHNVRCPRSVVGSNAENGIAEFVLFVPADEFTQAQKEELAAAAKEMNSLATTASVIVVELNIGDVILLYDTNLPDRWYGGKLGTYYMGFPKLETTSYNLTSISNDIIALKAADTTLTTRIATEETTRGNETSALQTAVNGHTTAIANINTALAGKQATLTFDSTPTANSTNPVTSGGIKTALDNLQSGLNLQSSVIGSVTISD